ncbi:MAG: hypothetical protein N3B16_01700 [Candidatus Aminicenantes bacterium]|nr:hypothetical protein [Candidatus Aminicenantes bacterium]
MNQKKLLDFVGWLWIIAGLISLLWFFLAILIFLGISVVPGLNETSRFLLRILALGSWALSAIFSLPQIIAGLGILRRQEWARLLTLLLAGLALFRFPLGTALGIFSLYILTRRDTILAFH